MAAHPVSDAGIQPEVPPSLDDKPLIKTYGSPVGKTIGTGTYGKVYVTDKNYAVKITTRKGQEILTTDLVGIVFPLSLHHPNIIKYFNVYIGSKDITLVMRVYQGDMLHMIARYPSLLRQLDIFKSFCAQMVSAVAYLTSRGIIHGDIKPNNILFQHEGDRKYKYVLADFDLAHDRRCELGDYKVYVEYYTEPYRPPEFFFLDRGTVFDHSADVWALGVTLATIFNHKHLFFENDHPENMPKNISKYVPRGYGPVSKRWEQKQVPVGLGLPFVNLVAVEVFLRKMIQFEPEDREDISELLEDPFLEGYVTGEKIPYARCMDSILYFDRKIDFAPIIQADTSGSWNTHMTWCIETVLGMGLGRRTLILATDLVARYILLDLNILSKSDLQLVVCAAIYVACRYFDGNISLRWLHKASNGLYKNEDITSKSEELLVALKFDLCAKNQYDDIFRLRSVYPSRELSEAVDLIAYSTMYSDLYFDPKNSTIALAIILDRHGIQHSLGPTQEEIKQWINKLSNYYEDYVGNLEDDFRKLVKTRLVVGTNPETEDNEV